MSQKHSKRAMAASASLIALAGAALGAAVMATAEAQDNLTPSLTAGIAPGAAPSFADLVEHVAPAVVSIEVVTEVSTAEAAGLNPDSLEGLPPELRRFFNIPEDAEPQEAIGAGSGFFISSDGLLVTNNHVVADASKITVTLNDGREFDATVVGLDEPTDLALLRVEGGDFPFVQFDSDPHVRVGDWVIAVGNPFGFGGTATAGIVSAVGREDLLQASNYNDFIQIDASINRGNSGGPTFDLNGNVIGVNSQIYSPTGASVGIGFAIPSDVASNIIEQLAENGEVTRGYLGVSLQPLDEDLRGAMGVPEDQGALVAEVTAGSPADDVGIQLGDVILGVNGERVANPTELTRLVGSLAAGEAYPFEIVRDGATRTLDVTLAVRPSERELAELREGGAPSAAVPEKVAPTDPVVSEFGLSLVPLTPSARSAFGIEDDVEGVVVAEVAEDSMAEEEGFQSGFVISQVNGQAVSTPEEFAAQVEAARSAGKSAVAMFLHAGGNSAFVALPFEDETDAG